jgi:sodium transport system permease protein
MTGLASLSLTAIGYCVSSFAKNVREAQQYLGPIFFVIFVPLYLGFGLSSQQISQYSALPVVGCVLLIRDVLLGTATLQEVGVSLGVNLAFFAFLVWLAIRMINSEKVVLRAA